LTNEDFERQYGDRITSDQERAYFWACVRGCEALAAAEAKLIQKMRQEKARAAFPRLSGVVVG
jgi:hypothetical protein